mgnify:CR=1 FL=1
MELPGLSKQNRSITLYYERAGFSAFVASSHRSTYIGTVANNTVGGYPALAQIDPQTWVSAQIGYEALEAQCASIQGIRLWSLGRLDEALERQERALELAIACRDRRCENIARTSIAAIHHERGSFDAALVARSRPDSNATRVFRTSPGERVRILDVRGN